MPNTAVQFKAKAGGSGDRTSQTAEQMLPRKEMPAPLSHTANLQAHELPMEPTNTCAGPAKPAKRSGDTSQGRGGSELFGNLLPWGVVAKSERYWASGMLAVLRGVSHCEKSALPRGFFFSFFRCSAWSSAGQDFWKKQHESHWPAGFTAQTPPFQRVLPRAARLCELTHLSCAHSANAP